MIKNLIIVSLLFLLITDVSGNNLTDFIYENDIINKSKDLVDELINIIEGV